jgi:hypothetical protein
MKLDFILYRRQRASVGSLSTAPRGQTTGKGAAIELRRNGNENNGNKTKKSRPTVSTRLDLFQQKEVLSIEDLEIEDLEIEDLQSWLSTRHDPDEGYIQGIYA